MALGRIRAQRGGQLRRELAELRGELEEFAQLVAHQRLDGWQLMAGAGAFSQFMERRDDAGMRWAVVVFKDLRDAAQQRPGFGVPLVGTQELREMAEANGNIDVPRAKVVFINRQRPAIKRLGFRPPRRAGQESGEVIEADGHAEMLRAKLGLGVGQCGAKPRLFISGHRVGRAWFRERHG